MSGPGVRFGLETLIRTVPEPRYATLRAIRDSEGAILDRGLVIFFPSPRSFTGEDMAELHLHGGRAVVAAVLEALGRLDRFDAAEPGEFTRRAFEHGRLDLTQVEGLADLVMAETEAQRRQALRQADGALGSQYEDWRQRLIRARAMVEAELDFPDEDDVPGSVGNAAWQDVAAVAAEMRSHLDDGHRGERLRDGCEIVVLGPPNAGKSSLINALARRDVAIVSTEPGTTRDLIEVRLDLDGYPVTVVDTAGLREAAGAIEEEGIRRARARAENADLVLWLNDVKRPPVAAVAAISQAVVSLGTKSDLIDSEAERTAASGRFDLLLSTASGRGLDELINRIRATVGDLIGIGEAPLATRTRHRQAVMAAQGALVVAIEETERALELRAEDLRLATDALGRLTGRVDVEDLLDVVFREFCIGK